MRKLIVLALGVSLAACSDGMHGVFAGIYISSFEASSFVRCGSRESWWLTDESHTLFRQLPQPEPPDYTTSAFIRVRAQVSSRGEYGHLGGSPREITVLEVLEVSADTTAKCR